MRTATHRRYYVMNDRWVGQGSGTKYYCEDTTTLSLATILELFNFSDYVYDVQDGKWEVIKNDVDDKLSLRYEILPSHSTLLMMVLAATPAVDYIHTK